MHQYSIKTQDLNNAHQALLEFVGKFEILYYQRQPEWLHFVQQGIHTLTEDFTLRVPHRFQVNSMWNCGVHITENTQPMFSGTLN
jgi:hypothetical protein